jgi:hypothetical protein
MARLKAALTARTLLLAQKAETLPSRAFWQIRSRQARGRSILRLTSSVSSEVHLSQKIQRGFYAFETLWAAVRLEERSIGIADFTGCCPRR